MDRAPGLPPKSVQMPTGPETTGPTGGIEETNNPHNIGSSTGPKKTGTAEGMGEPPIVDKKSTPQAKSTNKKSLKDAKPKTHWWNKAGAWFHAKGNSIKQWFSEKWNNFKNCFSGEQAEKAEQCVNNIASEVLKGAKDPSSLDYNSLATDIKNLNNLTDQIRNENDKETAQNEVNEIQNAVENAVADANAEKIENMQNSLDTDHFQAAEEQGINPMSDPLNQLIDLADETCGLAGEIAQRALKDINGVKMSRASIDFLKECYVGSINQPPELPKNWNDFQSGLEALKKDSPEIANYVCQQLFKPDPTNKGIPPFVNYFYNNLSKNLDKDGFPNTKALAEFGKQLVFIESVSPEIVQLKTYESDAGAKTLGGRVFQKLKNSASATGKPTRELFKRVFSDDKNFQALQKQQRENQLPFLKKRLESIGEELDQDQTLSNNEKNKIMGQLFTDIINGLVIDSTQGTFQVMHKILNSQNPQEKANLPGWFSYGE